MQLAEQQKHAEAVQWLNTQRLKQTLNSPQWMLWIFSSTWYVVLGISPIQQKPPLQGIRKQKNDPDPKYTWYRPQTHQKSHQKFYHHISDAQKPNFFFRFQRHWIAVFVPVCPSQIMLNLNVSVWEPSHQVLLVQLAEFRHSRLAEVVQAQLVTATCRQDHPTQLRMSRSFSYDQHWCSGGVDGCMIFIWELPKMIGIPQTVGFNTLNQNGLTMPNGWWYI